MSDKGHQFTYDIDQEAVNSGNWNPNRFYNFDLSGMFNQRTIDLIGQPQIKEVFVFFLKCILLYGS